MTAKIEVNKRLLTPQLCMTEAELQASPLHVQLHFFSVIPPVICVETAKVVLPQPLVTVNQKQNGFRAQLPKVCPKPFVGGYFLIG